jgi:DNA-binding transcriptional regulator YdaS (Cro superfamily)
MKLDEYIKQHTNRKAFAKVIGVKISYLNNLCQRPKQAGKKTIAKIEQATDGKVTFQDMIY